MTHEYHHTEDDAALTASFAPSASRRDFAARRAARCILRRNAVHSRPEPPLRLINPFRFGRCLRRARTYRHDRCRTRSSVHVHREIAAGSSTGGRLCSTSALAAVRNALPDLASELGLRRSCRASSSVRECYAWPARSRRCFQTSPLRAECGGRRAPGQPTASVGSGGDQRCRVRCVAPRGEPPKSLSSRRLPLVRCPRFGDP